MKRCLWLVCLVLITAGTAFAKAFYAGKEEMIRKADAIVIVSITKVEPTEKQGRPWRYHQKATATVEQCLKGGLAGRIEVHGMEDFICAQCRFTVGRFLLFLRRDGDLWTGSNWNLGIRPIKGDKVEWFKDGASLFEMTEQPLDAVVSEIKKTLDEPPPAPDKPPPK